MRARRMLPCSRSCTTRPARVSNLAPPASRAGSRKGRLARVSSLRQPALRRAAGLLRRERPGAAARRRRFSPRPSASQIPRGLARLRGRWGGASARPDWPSLSGSWRIRASGGASARPVRPSLCGATSASGGASSAARGAFPLWRKQRVGWPLAFPKENGVTFGGSVPRARAGCARCERSPPCARRRGGRLNDCGEGVRFQFEQFGSKVTF